MQVVAPDRAGLSTVARLDDTEDGAASRDRTRDILITNQALYQLSYDGMDGTAGFEPATFETKTRRSTS